MKVIRRGKDDDLIEAAHMDPELIPDHRFQNGADYELEQKKLMKNSKIAKWITGILTAALLILWPFPMFGSKYIFSKEFFTGWVVIGIIWVFAAFMCVGVYPLVEGRVSIGRTLKAMFWDISGKRKPRTGHINGIHVQSYDSDVPTKMGIETKAQNDVKS
jgi:formate hydrogenlyase subunit 3/multisubunit Na+/H+ antiporter MnhD subunit